MKLAQRGIALLEEFKLRADPASRALDLASGVGEVCKEVLKGTRYGEPAFQHTQNLEPEFVDAFMLLLTLAASVNVNLGVTLERSLVKMRDRLNKTGTISSEGA